MDSTFLDDWGEKTFISSGPCLYSVGFYKTDSERANLELCSVSCVILNMRPD